MKKVVMIVLLCLFVAGGCMVGCSVLLKKSIPVAFNKAKENILQGIDPATRPTEQELAQQSKQIKQQQADLFMAAQEGDVAKARQLLQQGISPNLVYAQGEYTPLMLAVRNGHKEMCALLLSAGADINAQSANDKTHQKRTPLLLAVDTENIPLVHMLLKAGASVYVADSRGFVPLHHASALGNKPIAQALLQAGSDINITSATRTTPLMLAAYEGQPEMIRFLIESGADVSARDKDGNTVLDYANNSSSSRKQQVLAILKKMAVH